MDTTPDPQVQLAVPLDLLRRANAFGIDVSRIIEAALEAAIEDARARWLDENKGAIDDYNAFIELHGLFHDEFREVLPPLGNPLIGRR